MHSFFYFVTLLAILPHSMQHIFEEGACECAVFPVQSNELIIKRSTRFNVTCDQNGEQRCKNLCVVLAGIYKNKASQAVCQKLDTYVQNLQVELYSKVCNSEDWNFTGLKSPEPLCCNGKEVIPCKEEVKETETYLNYG